MINTKLLTVHNIIVIGAIALIWQVIAGSVKQHLSSSQAGS
jgi:hypothetical protein